MAFFEERFPDSIAQGGTGGPRWKTTKNYSGGGDRSANKDWADALHYFNVAQAIQTLDDYDLVRSFFNVVAGGFDGFRYKDFTNYVATKDRGVLQQIGSSDVFQLFKADSFGARTWLRKIQKPVDGTLTVWRTRSAVESVITPAIDATTGLVTDSGHMAGDTYAWAGQFDVPCEFATDTMENAASIGADGGLLMGWDSIPIQELRNPV